MKDVIISGMGFMGMEDYLGKLVSQDGDFFVIDLVEPCPMHGRFIKRHKMWVTVLENK